jgi:uncharacterized membrane protein (Fun14 family)
MPDVGGVRAKAVARANSLKNVRAHITTDSLVGLVCGQGYKKVIKVIKFASGTHDETRKI